MLVHICTHAWRSSRQRRAAILCVDPMRVLASQTKYVLIKLINCTNWQPYTNMYVHRTHTHTPAHTNVGRLVGRPAEPIQPWQMGVEFTIMCGRPHLAILISVERARRASVPSSSYVCVYACVCLSKTITVAHTSVHSHTLLHTQTYMRSQSTRCSMRYHLFASATINVCMGVVAQKYRGLALGKFCLCANGK